MANHGRVSNRQSYLITEGNPPAHFLYISCRMPVVSIPKHTSELGVTHISYGDVWILVLEARGPTSAASALPTVVLK